MPDTPTPRRCRPGEVQRWIICQYHGGGGQTRPFNPRHERTPEWCDRCDLDPDTEWSLWQKVNKRHVDSLALAKVSRMDPPGDGHVWVKLGDWNIAHLYKIGARDGYCGKMRLLMPAAEDDRRAQETDRPCSACGQAYRAARARAHLAAMHGAGAVR
jgi:hypothetical protein